MGRIDRKFTARVNFSAGVLQDRQTNVDDVASHEWKAKTTEDVENGRKKTKNNGRKTGREEAEVLRGGTERGEKDVEWIAVINTGEEERRKKLRTGDESSKRVKPITQLDKEEEKSRWKNRRSQSRSNQEKKIESSFEETLVEVSNLISHLHVHRVKMRFLREEMKRCVDLEDHFRKLMMAEGEKLEKAILANRETIARGYDRLVRHCVDPNEVILRICKKSDLAYEDVNWLISRRILAEDVSRREKVDSRKPSGNVGDNETCIGFDILPTNLPEEGSYSMESLMPGCEQNLSSSIPPVGMEPPQRPSAFTRPGFQNLKNYTDSLRRHPSRISPAETGSLQPITTDHLYECEYHESDCNQNTIGIKVYCPPTALYELLGRYPISLAGARVPFISRRGNASVGMNSPSNTNQIPPPNSSSSDFPQYLNRIQRFNPSPSNPPQSVNRSQRFNLPPSIYPQNLNQAQMPPSNCPQNLNQVQRRNLLPSNYPQILNQVQRSNMPPSNYLQNLNQILRGNQPPSSTPQSVNQTQRFNLPPSNYPQHPNQVQRSNQPPSNTPQNVNRTQRFNLPPSNYPLNVNQVQMPPPNNPQNLNQVQMPPSNYPQNLNQVQMPPSNYPQNLNQVQMSPSNHPQNPNYVQMPPSNYPQSLNHVQRFNLPPSNFSRSQSTSVSRNSASSNLPQNLNQIPMPNPYESTPSQIPNPALRPEPTSSISTQGPIPIEIRVPDLSNFRQPSSPEPLQPCDKQPEETSSGLVGAGGEAAWDPSIPQKLTMKGRRFQAGQVIESSGTTGTEEKEVKVKKEDDDEIEIIQEKKNGDAGEEGRRYPGGRKRLCAEKSCTNVGKRVCMGCLSVIYCSDVCRLKHWNLKHNEECDKLKELRGV